MLRPKKNSYKEFDNEKIFLRLENSFPLPHNVSNGPSFRKLILFTELYYPSRVSGFFGFGLRFAR